MNHTLEQRIPDPRAADAVIPVAGLVPFSTVDFPHRLALVVFTQGCPWRCGYCHNAALRFMGQPASWTWRQVCQFLDERRGFLEAVVFSGGEPTLHHGLETALQTVRANGFLTGLHTAGIFPERLTRLLPWLDWVGLDIKAPLDERYTHITGDRRSLRKVLSSLFLLQSWGIALQLRTTVGPGAASEQDFDELRQQLRQLGAPEPVRQEVRPINLAGN